jgi:signal transduction histidine kinase
MRSSEPADRGREPERERTDESLRRERRNSDQAIAERLSTLDDEADALVEQARERADAVLDKARGEADSRREGGALQPYGRDAVAGERAVADEVLHEERAAADAAIRRERDEQARILAALLPFERDRTDRNLLTERARSDEAVEHRDDFMAMVSHDLRNMLSAILVDAMVLAEQASGTDEGQRTVAGMNRLQRHVARMNGLIGDLLDVVSIDAGMLVVHPEPGAVADLLGEAVDAFAAVAAEKGIAVEVESIAEGLAATVDHRRMRQVLGNLLGNALKFTPRGGRVTLCAASDPAGSGGVRLSVTDNGIGIPATMLEAIFERFWQVGKNDRRGTGLGLYISRCIVEGHGGKIWAESAVGIGTTIHLSLPALAAANADAGARSDG